MNSTYELSIFWESHDTEILNRSKVVLTAVYTTLFAVGVPGNLWVASIMTKIFTAQRRSSPSLIRRIQNQVKIYIFFLSLADLFVLLIIPFNLTDLWMGQWIFGHLFCKLYWGIESFNRVLSGCFLAALAFDRFKSITMPMRKFSFLHSNWGACLIILLVFIAVSALIAPILFFAGLQELNFGNGTMSKCMESMPQPVMRTFTTLLFCFGYLLPLLMIVSFNVRILLYVRYHTSHTSVATHVHLRRVVAKVLLTVLFHFICLTPYWLFVLLGSYHGQGFMLLFRKYKFYIISSLFIHTLPFLNSACNFIFYTLINKELRQQLTSSSIMGSQSNVLSHGVLSDRRTSRPSNGNESEPLRAHPRPISITSRMRQKRRSEPVNPPTVGETIEQSSDAL